MRTLWSGKNVMSVSQSVPTHLPPHDRKVIDPSLAISFESSAMASAGTPSTAAIRDGPQPAIAAPSIAVIQETTEILNIFATPERNRLQRLGNRPDMIGQPDRHWGRHLTDWQSSHADCRVICSAPTPKTATRRCRRSGLEVYRQQAIASTTRRAQWCAEAGQRLSGNRRARNRLIRLRLRMFAL